MVELCSCRHFTFLPLLLTLLTVVHCQLGRFALHENDVIGHQRSSTWTSLAEDSDDIRTASVYSRSDNSDVYDTDAPSTDTPRRVYSTPGCCLLHREIPTQPEVTVNPSWPADCKKRCKRLPNKRYYSDVADKKFRLLMKRRALNAAWRDTNNAAKGEMVTWRELLYDVISTGQAYWRTPGSETTTPIYLSSQPISSRRRKYRTKFQNADKSSWRNINKDDNLRTVTASKPDVGNVASQRQRFDEIPDPQSLPPTFDSEDVVVALRFGQEREPDGDVKVDGLFESRRSSPGPGVVGSNAGDRGGGGSNTPDKPPTAMSLRLALDAIAGLVQDRTNTGSSRFLTASGDDDGVGAGLDLGATIATHEKTSKYDRLTSIG